MSTPANSLDITQAGLVKFDGISNFTGVTVTNHNVLLGGASNAITSVAPSATSGVPLISQGAASDPVFGAVSVAGGGTGATTLTGILIGNGTSAITSVAVTQYDVLVGGASNSISSIGPGNAGQVLQSGGNAANPAYSTATYPSTSGTSGTILQSNGTNFVNSTPTYPTSAGASGNALISDGTNWVSSASFSSSALTYVSITLTSAQIKALHATPIQVVAAQGSGKVIVTLDRGINKFFYGGSNVFVAGASQTVGLYYSTTNLLSTIGNPIITGTSSLYNTLLFGAVTSASLATLENIPLNLYNPIATEISGNAANDNTISFGLWYYVVTL